MPINLFLIYRKIKAVQINLYKQFEVIYKYVK